MKFRSILAAAVAASAMAAASNAGAAVITFNLGGTTTSPYPGSYTYTVGGVTLTLTGGGYTFDANGISGHNKSEFSSQPLYRDAGGVGVCNAGETVGTTAPCSTVDTAPAGQTADVNESLVLTFSSSVTLKSLTVTDYIAGLTGGDAKNNSTLSVWNIASNGSLTTIAEVTGFTDTAPPATLNFSGAGFTSSAFALTGVGGKENGYKVVSLDIDYTPTVVQPPVTAPGVPEPATWALMIFGFGAAGSMLRRRQAAAVRA